jgi:hypothetical protein
VTDRLTSTLRREHRTAAGAFVLMLVAAACGSATSPSAPGWTFVAAPSATAMASSPTSTAAQASGVPPVAGLAATCAAQWAASLATYEVADARYITAVLFPKAGGDAPVVEPTAATLQTNQGPIELTVAWVSSHAEDTVWGTVRLDLALPRLKAGSYRAQFLDLADATGTWRFRVGDFVIRVLPGSAPGDLRPAGGTIETGQAEGGSVEAFEIGLQNMGNAPIEVTSVRTNIPGLPVMWVLAEGDPLRVVERVRIPAGKDVMVTVGTAETARPVAFVLATPEIAYRVAGSPGRLALFDPVLFKSGFGEPSDASAYAAGLPADACARKP